MIDTNFNVHQDRQCSKCGKINKIEYILRGYPNKLDKFIKCTNCGHEVMADIPNHNITWTTQEEYAKYTKERNQNTPIKF